MVADLDAISKVFFTPPPPPPTRFGVRGDVGVRGWAHSIARPWVPISSLLTHIVYLLPSLSHLAGPKSVSARPSDPDTMTNTALEATASSSGNKN